MMKGGHGQTNKLQDNNWGALHHASRAPQSTSRNYYTIHLCMYVSCEHVSRGEECVSVHVGGGVKVWKIKIHKEATMIVIHLSKTDNKIYSQEGMHVN